MARRPRSPGTVAPPRQADVTTPATQRLSQALRRQTARMVEAPGQGVRKLAHSVGQAAQLGDRSLRTLTNSLFSAFQARDLCSGRRPARG